jgi:hypothetical protein
MKLHNIVFASILLSNAALSSEHDGNSVYQAGGQYTATLNSANSQWRLLPSDGQDFTIQLDRNCHSSAVIPPGLWLFTRDANGKPELLAPSQTVLPAGHRGYVPVVDCVDKRDGALPIPASLIEWLGNNTGAIYVK